MKIIDYDWSIFLRITTSLVGLMHVLKEREDFNLLGQGMTLM